MVLVYWCFGAAGQFNVALNPIPCIHWVINIQVIAVTVTVTAIIITGAVDVIITVIVGRITILGVLVHNILIIRGGESTIKQRNRILFTDFGVNVCEIVLGETGPPHESLRLLQ